MGIGQEAILENTRAVHDPCQAVREQGQRDADPGEQEHRCHGQLNDVGNINGQVWV